MLPSPLPDPIIVAQGIKAGYTSKLILKGVDATFPRGKITCVIGGSGCGKSTLLKTFVNLLEPREGRAFVFGQDPMTLDESERGDLLSNIGLMFQYGALLGSLTLRENLTIPLRAHTRLPQAIIDEIIRMKLDLVGLAHAIDLLPSELSGGMRKRAGLARAIMLDPPVLMCDEPSAGLDPVTMDRIDDLLLSFKSLFSMTMLIITHELSSIKKVADRIVMLDQGRTHFMGSLDEALETDDPIVRNFFDRRAESQGSRGRTLLQAVSA